MVTNIEILLLVAPMLMAAGRWLLLPC